MSDFRKRLLELMVEQRVAHTASNSRAFTTSSNLRKTLLIFKILKTEFGLSDTALMQHVCFYSRTRNMVRGEDTQGNRLYSTPYHLRVASIVLLLTQTDAYLPLLFNNGSALEVKLECAVASMERRSRVDEWLGAANKLKSVSQVCNWLLSRPEQNWRTALSDNINRVLVQYRAGFSQSRPEFSLGGNYHKFKALNKLLGDSSIGDDDCQAAFINAVHHLEQNPGRGRFKQLFSENIHLEPLRKISYVNDFERPGSGADSGFEGRRLSPFFIPSAPDLVSESAAGSGSGAGEASSPELPAGAGTGSAAGAGVPPSASLRPAPAEAFATPFLNEAIKTVRTVQVIAGDLRTNLMRLLAGSPVLPRFLNSAQKPKIADMLQYLKSISDGGSFTDPAAQVAFFQGVIKKKLPGENIWPPLSANQGSLIEAVETGFAELRTRYENNSAPTPSAEL